MKTFNLVCGIVRYYSKQAFLMLIEKAFGVSYAEAMQDGLSKRIAFYEYSKR